MPLTFSKAVTAYRTMNMLKVK